MSNSIGESWDTRIRERARQYAERGGKDAMHNWLSAKGDLWREALVEQQPLALKLNWMRENLDEGTDEGLRAAAITGCELLRIMVSSSGVINELSQKAGKLLIDPTRTDVSDYLADADLVDDFLAIERSILIRSGLLPSLATELCCLLGRYYTDSVRNNILQADIISLLNKAVDKACNSHTLAERADPRPAPTQPPLLFRKSMRALWLVGAGGLIVGSNVAATLIIGDVTLEISKAVGSAVIGSGVTTFLG